MRFAKFKKMNDRENRNWYETLCSFFSLSIIVLLLRSELDVYEIINALNNFKLSQILKTNVAEAQRLIMKDSDNKIKIICAFENLFDEINAIHLSVGLSWRVGKTKKACKEKFDNINKKILVLYNEFCTGCQQRAKLRSKKVVIKAFVSTGFMNRCQLDLVDFQPMPDGIWKWIMHCQHYHNKLSFLEALQSKCAREVALRLISIFTIIGSLFILQMDDGREFVAQIIQELKKLWPW
ncbi:SCAN domain-containing 3 [Brachionus plicatilis]|uniref:SCAN domain-containing 3 n=1 Tax=Brachionus plicatilis TaxID=10195 RepID=A0A3M7R6B3_BRAPC|nr:SCAN domain-containing 3 [Brachionus plicatilis]